MSKVTDVRRENIRALIKERGGVSRLTKAMAYKNASFLSQMAGPNPTREVTEKTARKIEEVLGLESGVLDREAGVQPQTAASARSPASPALTPEFLGEVIRLVGRAYEAERVPLAPMKFSDVVALTVADSIARGGQPDENHVRAVVRLLKG